MLGYKTFTDLQNSLIKPFEGQTAYIESQDKKLVFNGTEWVDYDPEIAVEGAPEVPEEN